MIAVLTFKRLEDISQALPQLRQQALLASETGTTTSIVVVDNDPAASACELVQKFSSLYPDVPVRYEHEAIPGIAAARNRALAAARKADLLVFIDDDERPSERWLPLLLETYRAYRCAAVVGPVISEFANPPDPWITAGRFFVRLRRQTGSPVHVAATNNLLLDMHEIRRHGLQFDMAFGISGGSDTKFTRELHHRGGLLIWCDEALVTDVVPASRATRSWVMRRALRSGNGESATSLALAGSRVQTLQLQVQLTARGLVRVVAGLTRLAIGTAARSLAHRARGARTLARGVGLVSGAWGYVYQEYKRAS